MPTWDERVGGKLKMLRKERKLPLRTAADDTGVPEQRLIYAETGNCRLTCQDFYVLAEYFQVPVEFLMN